VTMSNDDNIMAV